MENARRIWSEWSKEDEWADGSISTGMKSNQSGSGKSNCERRIEK